MKKEAFFSDLENKYPDDVEINRTQEFIKIFDFNNGKELTQLFLKSDVILLVDVFEKFNQVSTREYGINPLCCVRLPVYMYQGALEYTDIKIQTLQHKDLIFLTVEIIIIGGLCRVMGDRYVVSDESKEDIMYGC